MTEPTQHETGATVILVFLATGACLLGLLREGHYVESGSELLRLQAQDAVIFTLGVPVLLIGLWLSLRGSIRGRLLWLGSLAFIDTTARKPTTLVLSLTHNSALARKTN